LLGLIEESKSRWVAECRNLTSRALIRRGLCFNALSAHYTEDSHCPREANDPLRR